MKTRGNSRMIQHWYARQRQLKNLRIKQYDKPKGRADSFTLNEVRMILGFPVGTTVLEPIPGVTITCTKREAKDENCNRA